jgi:integrase
MGVSSCVIPYHRRAAHALWITIFADEQPGGGTWVFCHEDEARIGDVKRGFATARDRAKIDNFRVHDLRHTCAAWLVSAGVPLSAVRDLRGHTKVRMTERYAHLAPENLRSAVDSLVAYAPHSGRSTELKVIEGGCK